MGRDPCRDIFIRVRSRERRRALYGAGSERHLPLFPEGRNLCSPHYFGGWGEYRILQAALDELSISISKSIPAKCHAHSQALRFVLLCQQQEVIQQESVASLHCAGAACQWHQLDPCHWHHGETGHSWA